VNLHENISAKFFIFYADSKGISNSFLKSGVKRRKNKQEIEEDL
jgi:hypothetical protein